MKTLIVSIYDSGYGGYSAAILNENYKLRKLKISKNTIDLFDSGFWGDYKETPEVIKYVEKYDHAIVCNNGDIVRIK